MTKLEDTKCQNLLKLGVRIVKLSLMIAIQQTFSAHLEFFSSKMFFS